jgi:hypothetical protein
VDEDARAYLVLRHRPIGAARAAAVTRYSDGGGLPGSDPVNMPLRTGVLGFRAAREVALLDCAIALQVPLDRTLVLWRAIGPNGLERLRRGGVDHGFTSASTSRAHVEAAYMREGSRLLMVEVLRGSRVLHMPSVGSGGTLGLEDEVLIGRGAMLQVERERGDGIIEVRVT